MRELSIEQLVKLQYADKTPSELLRSAPSVLIGIDDRIASVLSGLAIKTVFDLSQSRIFRAAEQIAQTLSEETSIFKLFGRVATEMVNDDYLDMTPRQLASQSILVLEGIGPRNFQAVRSAIQLDTVRDLSLWPPYLAAKTIYRHAFNIDNARLEDPEAPGELLPVARSYWTERRFIKKLFIEEVAANRTNRPLNQPIDVLAALEGSYFTQPLLGAMLTFEQTWTPHGLSLGSLVHSLALAPAESTRIALVDWQRQEAARLSESTDQQERLSNLLSQESAISEIANGVISEVQEGKSATVTNSSSTSGGSSSGVLGSLFGGTSSGNASTTSKTLSVASSSGKRDVALSTSQDIRQSTQQQAASVRSRRATAVKEVEQSEKEEIRTRIITNYNHSHALSIHYYEVLQIYKMMLRHTRTDRLVFVPMQPLNLKDRNVLRRFRHVLKAAARNDAELDLIAHYTGEVRLENLAPQVGVKPRYIYVNDDAVVEAIEVSGASLYRRWEVSQLQLKLQNDQTLQLDDFRQVQTATFRFEPSRLLTVRDIVRIGVKYKHLLEYEDRMFAQTSLFMKSGNSPVTLRLHHHLPTTRSGETNSFQEKWLVGVDPGFYSGDFINVLDEDKDHFSRVIWNSLDESQIARLLQPYTFKNRPLLGSVDFPPLGVYGNCLVFIYRHEDDPEWRTWKKTHISDLAEEEDFISVPTGGLFAESVLGRYNASEKIDLTRFWNWQDSPIPFGAPDIAPVSAGSRYAPDGLTTGNLEPSAIQLMQPNPLPTPQGMSALQGALTTSEIFRNMSGLVEGIAANTAGMQVSGQAAVQQASLASENFKTAVNAVGDIVKTAIGLPPTGSEGGKSSTQLGGEINLAKTIDAMKSGAAGGSAGSAGVIGGGANEKSALQSVLESSLSPVRPAVDAITGSRAWSGQSAVPSSTESGSETDANDEGAEPSGDADGEDNPDDESSLAIKFAIAGEDGLNIREKADSKSEILGKLRQGTIVEVLGSENNRVQICTDEGITGYTLASSTVQTLDPVCLGMVDRHSNVGILIAAFNSGAVSNRAFNEIHYHVSGDPHLTMGFGHFAEGTLDNFFKNMPQDMRNEIVDSIWQHLEGNPKALKQFTDEFSLAASDEAPVKQTLNDFLGVNSTLSAWAHKKIAADPKKNKNIFNKSGHWFYDSMKKALLIPSVREYQISFWQGQTPLADGQSNAQKLGLEKIYGAVAALTSARSTGIDGGYQAILGKGSLSFAGYTFKTSACPEKYKPENITLDETILNQDWQALLIWMHYNSTRKDIRERQKAIWYRWFEPSWGTLPEHNKMPGKHTGVAMERTADGSIAFS